jgi:hypothetical protein
VKDHEGEVASVNLVKSFAALRTSLQELDLLPHGLDCTLDPVVGI